MIEFDVAIAGGGFSGSAVAAHVAAQAPPELSLLLFEPDELGRGAAYGTKHREHLLNTRASLMSLYSDDPDHFVRWLGARGGPNDFVSRRLYGKYVGEIARRAFERPRFSHVRHRAATVRRGERGGFVVESSSGTRFGARCAVVATGNPDPNDDFLPLEIRLHPGYIADPWRFDYRRVGGQVLVVGSGLTALDVLVALKACGHRGTVHVLSRHGRFPEIHASVARYDVIPALDTHNARSLLRSLRRHVAEAATRGFDWRAVIDSLRPEAEAIWRRVGPAEQRRFERHLRSQWERYRHRAPEAVEAVRREYRGSGRLFSYAGRLAGAPGGVVTIAQRDGKTVELHPDWIVNCSGVGRARAMAKNPLLGEMLVEGTISPEAGGLGLRVTRDLVAIDEDGREVPGLWIVGPPVRGSRFEATAVPELRGMAELAASEILHRLSTLRPSEPKIGDRSRSPSWVRTV
jgi:uncharacterized NAD(P)/FAD-binding protein YdhS